MRAKKPTGKQKRSVQKKVDWKALEIVHPDAAGIDVGGSEHWVASARTAIRSLYGGSDVLPRIYGRWRFGWWRKECAAWPCNRRGCIVSNRSEHSPNAHADAQPMRNAKQRVFSRKETRNRPAW